MDSCSQRHTEDKPIAVNQKACQSVSQSSSVVFDGSGQSDGERNVDQSFVFGVTRNPYSAHSKFPKNTQTEKMVDGSGQPDERNSSNLLEEQRQMIIAEYREKVGHHELQAPHASTKSYRNGGITEIPKFYLRYDGETKTHRGPEHYFGFIREQALQNEVNCMILMKDSKDFQDLSSQWKIPTLPVNQCHSHLIRYLKLRHFFASPCRREGPPSIWVTHGISGNVFANPHASSSAPHPQELNQWNSSIEERFMERSERPEQNQDLRCQSGPSAKNTVIFSGGDSLKNYGADQQRLQISDLHFDKFPAPATFASWKTRF